ncbi:efflux RND transporter periplasmic adaptor subunit [Methyloterricola oryzae]|uniref:efflux RND transporter periplasmic adaptor subunit n=1 Tax=Methyloterricola oryzae TaxID=1495050 RepID=UPI00069A0053|nr:efflux RND transporter periplasmic adaptor subunit [Methyloterricola oryzae]
MPPQPDTVSSSAKLPKLGRSVIVLTSFAAFAVCFGLVSRAQDQLKLQQWTEMHATPNVAIVHPTAATESAHLELPGRIEAFSQAPIFARVSGYLKYWNLDIGASVKAGQVLAEIETPDLDQQLMQAKADVATAEADAKFAASTARRWRMLLDSDSAAQQEVDEKLADAAAKEAALGSARANLQRYTAMKGFTRLIAPFDGIITKRNTDVGALIAAGTGAGQELFTLAQVKKLRVYVSVPQSFAPQVHTGIRARITVPDQPGRSYGAEVAATAGAIDAASGTSLVQLLLDNTEGNLLPGGYANVKLELPGNTSALSIPASALVLDARGAQVATLGIDNRILLKPVIITRDLGKTIEISDGIRADERIIDNPPDGVASGDEVRVADVNSGAAG